MKNINNNNKNPIDLFRKYIKKEIKKNMKEKYDH